MIHLSHILKQTSDIMEINTKQKEENYTSPEMRIILFTPQSMILDGSPTEQGEPGDEHGWS